MSSQRIVDLRKGKSAPRREAPRVSARTPDRRPSLRDRRRKKRLLIIGSVIVAIALVGYGIRVVSYLPRFTVQDIHVTGAQKVPPEIVEQYLNSILNDGRFHFLSRRDILLYPKHALEMALAKNFPRIESAQISRASLLSNALSVSLTERRPFARWCQNPTDAPEQCYLLDEHGFIFADSSDASESPSTPYRFSGGIASAAPIGSVFAPGHLSGIVAMMKLLAAANMNATAASIQNDQDFFVTLDQGFYIKASYGEDATQLVRNLQLILNSDALRDKASQLDYIDLRFGNRVYYKLKGQAEAPAQ
jgi:cell division septal protein FtsQ